MKHKSCSHIIHFIVSILFWPWVFVWIICALRVSAYNRRIDSSVQKEILEEMKKLNKGVI